MVNGPIGESDRGARDGVTLATHDIRLWLENEAGLLARARQLIAADERDGTVLFPLWVEFLLFGNPQGKFNLSTEPKHDARTAMDLKHGMDRDDFRRVDWAFVRESVTGE